MTKNISIGISDFKKIIDNQVFYVDKTYFLKEWLDCKDDVTLITRPRRFGKTLTMSMVNYFLSDKHKDERYLFDDLYISKCDNAEYYMEQQGNSPVIFLSFAGVKGDTFKDTCDSIKSIITNLYINEIKLLDYLNEFEKEYFVNICKGKASDNDYIFSIARLSHFFYKYTGKLVYILLDEYDTPMQNAYVKNFWNEMVSFVMGLLVNTFKDNRALNRAIITGITRISKESIFSDLNNLRVITIMSEAYADCLGFTEEETNIALEQYGLSSEKETIKKYYNGFIMGNGVSIYNPWSIISFLVEKKYNNYWANTSSNKLINDVIAKSSPKIKLKMEHMLSGGSIYEDIKDDIVFSDLDTSPDTSIWSLMVASGYMKVCGYIDSKYELKLTNMEIISMFQKMFKDWFSIKQYEYSEFIEALLNGDVIEMEENLNDLALSMFGMFDVANGDSKTAPEKFYHGFVLGMLVDLKDRFIIESNKESGLGRYDIIMIPRDKSKDVGVIMEFKVFSPRKEKDIETSVNNALNQIENKKYEQVLKEHGVNTIYKYAIAFKGKECKIGMK